ncbi:major facilitator superfamily domain-containing protein [Dactylonectria estremocensis]|uniref:Major facilitator superfamily domain-containing protein n=1 Tax=Dactylonectria estremocensis TaxID=1079267 RepID=A0A9P9D8B0_9HYPO|nr:major facilitator superfamily domain-containing protein [Dactylonectria estremocensis]
MASEVCSFSSSSTSTRELSKRDSLHAAGSVFFVSSAGRVLRLPIPSTSHRDPLTWCPSKRAFAFIALQLYSIVASFELNLPGFLVKAIQKEFANDDIAPFSVQTLSSAMTLFVGIGYLVGIPLSTAVGRRPVLLGSALLTTGSTFWAGVAGNFPQLLIAIGLQGLACGGATGMFILILIDATFIHERPNALSLYWCSGAVFVKLSLIILPFTTDLSTNWRSVYQGWLAPCLVALTLALIFIPETYFLRPPVALDGRILVQSSSEKVQIYEGWEDVEAGSERPLPELPVSRSPLSHLKVSRAPGTSWAAMAATYKQILLCILNPLTFWVSLLTGVILSGVIYLNLAQPSVLVVRWGEDPETVSMLSGVSGIVGSLLAFPATGPLASWFTRFYSLRMGGIRHAEVYLPIFALPVLSGLISVILNAFAIEEEWAPTWMYITSALSLFSFLTGNVAFTLWITEAFPRWAAAALAVQLFTSNMISFGIGTAIMPWVETKHIVEPAVVISVLMLVLGVLAVPAAFWGKNVRQFIHGRWSDSEKGALRPQ